MEKLLWRHCVRERSTDEKQTVGGHCGPPKCGKSTFFNRVVGRRVAIVEDTPGVTRDRIYADVEWGRHSFSLIDTGGIDPAGEGCFVRQDERASRCGHRHGGCHRVFVDGKHGSPSPDDEDVATLLRHTKKPVVLAVNKMDNPHSQEDAYNFYTLGMGDPFPISATLGIGIGDVLDEIVSHLPVQEPEEEEGEKPLEIAVIRQTKRRQKLAGKLYAGHHTRHRRGYAGHHTRRHRYALYPRWAGVYPDRYGRA